MAKKNVIEQMIGMLRAPIAQRKGVAIPPDECAIWAKELERYLVIEKEKKDQIETKEVDLETFDKRVTEMWGRCAANPNDTIACLHIDSFIEIARHFFELGLKASDTELENLIQTLPERIADERSHQVYLMSLYRFDGQCVVDYVGELEEDSLVCFEGETFMEAATKMREWIRKRPKLRKI